MGSPCKVKGCTVKTRWSDGLCNLHGASLDVAAAKPAATNELTIAPLDGWDDDPTPEPDFSVDVEPALVPECDAAKALAEWAKVDVGRRLTVYADIRANCDDEAMLTALDALEGLTEATAAALLLAGLNRGVPRSKLVALAEGWADNGHGYVRDCARELRTIIGAEGKTP